MKSDFVWMDGKIVPFADAKIDIPSPTLHYGPEVFEGVRCYDTAHGPATFRLWEHMVRFTRSIHKLGFESPTL